MKKSTTKILTKITIKNRKPFYISSAGSGGGPGDYYDNVTYTGHKPLRYVNKKNECSNCHHEMPDQDVKNMKNKNNNNLENDDDELPSLEEIIKGDNQKKIENKIDDNGNFNINYVDNINNYYNNNDKGNENNNKIENSGAPPSFGEFI